MISLLRDSEDLWYFTDSDGSESEHVKYLEGWDLSLLHEKWGLHGDIILKQKLDMISNHGGSIGYNGKARDRINEWMLKTVKHDLAARNVVFDVGLSAYSSNPLNLFMKGPSSIGKTYITLQSLKPFPDEDKIILGDISPTALVHDYGLSKFIDEEGREIDYISEVPERNASKEDKKEWHNRLKSAKYQIDLTNKIIVFLELPRMETFQKLRPLLSHDKYETEFKITDKSSSGRLQTKTVVIKGWPATIFCTSDRKYVEDLATRSFTVTPEVTKNKIKAANRLTANKHAFPWLYEEDEDLRYIRSYIQKIKEKMNNRMEAVIPYTREFCEIHPASEGRDMRDFDHVLSLIKCNAFLNMHHRPRLKVDGEEYIITILEDLKHTLDIYREFAETTRTGLDSIILRFFHEVVETFENSPLYEEVIRKYNDLFSPSISSNTVYDYAKKLQEVGWLDIIADDIDKRKRRLKVLNSLESNPKCPDVTFSSFFTGKDFRKWLDDIKIYSPEKQVRIEPPLSMSETLQEIDEETLLKMLTQMFFSGKYFQEEKEPVTETIDEEDGGDVPSGEKGLFSGDFSDEFKQWHLREGKTLEEEAVDKIVELSGRDEDYAKEFIENEIASSHMFRTKMGELVPVA
jgi:hypothetical protein